MADPTGTNLTSGQADELDNSSPVARKYKTGARLRSLRSDLDANGTLSGTALTLNPDNGASGSVIVPGDLTVNGATTTVSTTNTVVKDQLIELGNGRTGSASGDAGIVIERGSDANVGIFWDESADTFVMGSGSITGASTGDLTITNQPLVVSQLNASAGIEVTSAGTATVAVTGSKAAGNALNSSAADLGTNRKGVITIDFQGDTANHIDASVGVSQAVTCGACDTDSVVVVCTSNAAVSATVAAISDSGFTILVQNQTASEMTTNFTLNYIIL